MPTPSVPDTRIGSMKPAAFRSNSPAKPPSSALQPDGRKSERWSGPSVCLLGWMQRKDLKFQSKKFIAEKEKTVSHSCLSAYIVLKNGFKGFIFRTACFPTFLKWMSLSCQLCFVNGNKIHQCGMWPLPEAWSSPPVCYQQQCPLRCPCRSALCRAHS